MKERKNNYVWIKQKRFLKTEDLLIGLENNKIICFANNCKKNGKPSDNCSHVKKIKNNKKLKQILFDSSDTESLKS